jgi:high-affinity iron transporter
MDFSAAIPTFIITLREGVEATLVAGIVLAILAKANQRQLFKWVYLGAIAGILASSILGAMAQALIGGFSGQVYYLAKGIFSVAAIVMLSWMLIWMTQQARLLKKEIEANVGQALTNQEKAGWSVFTLVAVAILREGAEIVLFIAGSFSPDSTQSGLAQYSPALGCILGILTSTAIGAAIFKFGAKINIRLFFQILGTVLLLIVSGLVITALSALDLANTIDKVLNPTTGAYEFLNPPQRVVSWFGLGPLVTDTSNNLPSDKFPGILLATMFGYTDKLYALPLCAYVTFLSTAGTIYFQTLSGRQPFASKKISNDRSSLR